MKTNLPKIGDRVYWVDPDTQHCNGYGIIAAIRGEGADAIYAIKREDGGEVEALEEELTNHVGREN